MSRLTCVCVFLGAFVPVASQRPVVFPAGHFGFAGLSLHTTFEDARQRYPTSLRVGNYIYVSDHDSHDDIHGIELTTDASHRRLRLLFERSHPRRPRYPRCALVMATIAKQYGEPASTQDFDVERDRTRRLTWWSGTETLSLVCFRRTGAEFLAAELIISMRDNM